VTRFAESASFDGVTSALGENTTDIALLFEFDAPLPASGFPYLGRLYDSATTQGVSGAYNFYLARNVDKLNYYNEIKSVTVQNGVYTSTSNDITLSYTTGLNPKTPHKVAFTYNPNIVSAEALRSVNSASLSSTAGITQYPISLDKLFIGSLSKTANHLNGHVKSIKIYNKKLPQTDINNLTT
jgi:hypothetical protein